MPRRRPDPTGPAPDPTAASDEPPYTRTIPPRLGDKESVTTTFRPGDDSTVVLDVEIDQRQLQAAIDEGVRHLGRRTRIPGFRPGKMPRPMLERALGVRRSDPDAPNPIYDEAREHLYERTVLAALQRVGRRRPADPGGTRVAALRGGGRGRLLGPRARTAAGQARRLRGLPLHAPGRGRHRRAGRPGRRAAA